MLDVMPLNRRVIAKVLEVSKEVTTKSGILIDEGKPKKENFLEVVAVDPSITDIKVGDKIYVSRFSGDVYKEGEEEYNYVEYKDILGKKTNG